MDIAIQMPQIYERSGNLMESKPPITNSSNTYLAGSFTFLSSGVQAAVATAGVLCYGWSASPSITAGQVRPAVYYETPYAYDPSGNSKFILNITDSSAHVGQANGAPQLSAVTIGNTYGIIRPTTGTYAGFQMLNVSDTTNAFFKVVALAPGALTTDYNGQVVVTLVGTVVQA